MIVTSEQTDPSWRRELLKRIDAVARASRDLEDWVSASPAPVETIEDLALPLGRAAGQLGVSEDALRKKLRRTSLGFLRGGRVYVFQSVLPHLYPKKGAKPGAAR